MVWHDLGLNPGLPDHWLILYPLGQWTGWHSRFLWRCFMLLFGEVQFLFFSKPCLSHLVWDFTCLSLEISKQLLFFPFLFSINYCSVNLCFFVLFLVSVNSLSLLFFVYRLTRVNIRRNFILSFLYDYFKILFLFLFF